MGRPPKNIDWDLVERKVRAGCTAKEIFSARNTKMNMDTFYDNFIKEFGCRFSEFSEETAPLGEGDLKYMLYESAMNGNITCLIFLARTRLGMKEPEITQSLPANQSQLDYTHMIMQLEHRNLQLLERIEELEKLNAQ